MLSGKFNYHKIMFTLEVLESIDEKIAYITHIRKDIAKTIKCFESEKIVNLRMYGDETIHLDDNCPELQGFIQEMIKKYSPAIPDRRVPSNEQLRDLVKKEAQEYHKLDRIMEFYFLELKRDADIVTLEDEKNILNKALNNVPTSNETIPLSIQDKTKTEESHSHPEVNIISSIETDSINFTSNNNSSNDDETELKNDEIKNYNKKILKQIVIDNKKKKEDPPKDDIVRDSQ